MQFNKDEWDLRQLIPPESVDRTYDHYLRAKCPFHHDIHPSLLVFAGGYLCKACGARGDAIEWLRRRCALSFSGAVKYLQNFHFSAETTEHPQRCLEPLDAGIVPAFVSSLHRSKDAQAPLFAEGLTESILYHYQIGLYQRPATYTIPMWNPTGELLNVKLYQMQPIKAFWWLTGRRPTDWLYGISKIDDWRQVYVVESPKDVWVMKQDGLEALAVPDSATSWRQTYNRGLENAAAICLVGDNDKAGQLFMKRIRRSGLRRAYPFYWPDLVADAPEGFDYTKYRKGGGSVENFVGATKVC